jgi:hypothetical protein
MNHTSERQITGCKILPLGCQNSKLLQACIQTVEDLKSWEKTVGSHLGGSGFNLWSDVCADYSAHRLNPSSLPKIKRWYCEVYQMPTVAQSQVTCRSTLLTIILMITLSL